MNNFINIEAPATCRANPYRATQVLLCISIVFLMFVGGAAFAAPEVTTNTQTSEESTTATESNIFEPDAPAVQSVVLLGEKVSLDNESPVKGPFPPLLEITTRTITGSQAMDYTLQGVTIAETAVMVAAAESTPPDVAIIFAGYSDEQQKVDDEQQRVSLKKLIEILKSKNPAMHVFLVPAATTIGAITNANLRLIAADGNATYIPLGTEIGGEPYLEALQAINDELSTADDPDAEAEQPEASTSAPGAYIRSSQEDASAAEAESTPSAEYNSHKDTLQQELERIAGESGDAQSLPALSDTVITTATDLNTTGGIIIPPGGLITKRGVEAQESINMRPLPAVKAFRPQIPVPRNNLDKKEPALSR